MRPRLTRSLPHLLGLLGALLVTHLVVGADIVINEIHYRPPNKTVPEEFVELHNRGGDAVDVSGWFFSSGVDYTIPDGTVIEPGGFLVIAADPETLAGTLGVERALGPFAGRLSNEGESIVLRSAFGDLEDSVSFGVGFPWPMASNGFGSSMELVHPDFDNDLGGSWRASGQISAFPSERVSIIDPEDDSWRYRKATSEPSDPPSAWRAIDFVEDDSWLVGKTSIGFGDDDDNTLLDDMRNNYTGIYLRHEFTIDDPAEFALLKLGLFVDDGAIVWINGFEVQRLRVADGEIPFDGKAARSGEARWTEFVLSGADRYLVRGKNVLAMHALNISLTSNDFSSDAMLFIPTADDFDDDDLLAPPTPGARNTVFAENVGPSMRQVRHSPARPRGRDPVVVTVKVTDAEGVEDVKLAYQIVDPGAYIRLDDPEYETAWTEVAMFDDGLGADQVPGDDVFTALMPRDLQVHRRLMRYRLVARDRTGLSVRAPSIDDTQPNFAYFVYDGVPAWRGASSSRDPVLDFGEEVMRSLPVYHLIARVQDVMSSQYDSRFENRHLPGTLVYEDQVLDHIAFEVRGEFSTYVSGKNKWRFHFNRGHDFQARDDHGRQYRAKWRTMNFSGLATPWVPTNRGMAGLDEGVSFGLYGLAGVPSPKTNYVHFRVIDDDEEASPTNQYNGDLWGLYMTIEHTDGRFLDERGLPDGNTYKIEGGNGDKRNQGPTQTPTPADYNALKTGYNQRQPIAWWRANVDLEGYYSFRAVNYAINNHDLREGWNICQYHNPETGRWSVIPWDLDMLYMPVTHWSGVMNFQNAIIQNAELRLEHMNRVRELLDLLFTEDQFGQFVDEYTAIIKPPEMELGFVDVDEAMWNFHPRTAGNHRGAFYRNPSSHSARGGTISRRLVSADIHGMGRWAKDFVIAGVGAFGGARARAEARDPRIPVTPEVTAVGSPDFPIDDLVFETGPFSDPDGDDTFGAMKWRIAEVRAADSPPPSRGDPGLYEINATWESEELAAFEPRVAIPPHAVKIGATYRVRVRMMDDNRRWSHWSAPVELITSAPTTPFPQQESLRITEVMFNPLLASEDLEFVELQNVGTAAIDLLPVEFVEGIEFRFRDGDVDVLTPGEFVLVVGNRRVFEAKYGAGLPVAGEYRGRLANGGERVVLSHGPNATILDFAYSDEWYAETDGGGRSLVVVDTRAPLDAWSQPGNWKPSARIGGSPGAAEEPTEGSGRQLPGDANQDGQLNISDAVALLARLFVDGSRKLPCGDGTIDDPSNRALLDADGDRLVNVTDAIHTLNYLFTRGPAPALGERCVELVGCPDLCFR